MKLLKNKKTDYLPESNFLSRHSEGLYPRGIHGRKMPTQNQTNQHGRSMVEMLGVLAVIGVLSIGGISGYRMAMNKHNAQQLMNALVIDQLSNLSSFDLGRTPPDSIKKLSDAELARYYPNVMKLNNLYTSFRAYTKNTDTEQSFSFYLNPNDNIWQEFCQLSPALDGLVDWYRNLDALGSDVNGNPYAIYNDGRYDETLTGWHTEFCDFLYQSCPDDKRPCNFYAETYIY